MRQWTGRVLGAVALALTITSTAASQQVGTVTGQIINVTTKQSLSGAQVFIVGTNIGGLTNAEGRFTLPNVPVGAHTVRVQTIGYATKDQSVTVTAGATTNVRFEMTEDAIALNRIVVTALGIEKSERSLGYAVQTVSSAMLDRSPEVTLVNALAGQAAGVQVISSSGRPGAGARITIRGESSFLGGGQPLFIIDGVPISIDTDSKMTAVNLASPQELDYGEAGNRAMDIDPNSIEEISILRGAAATALYGSRAASGAVIIKTKQGRPGQPARFTFSSRVAYDRPILGGYVTDWAAGDAGYFCNGRITGQGGWCQPGFPSNNPNPATGLNWGPHKDSIPQIVLDSVGEVRFRDTRADFYRTGRTLENSLNVAGSLSGGNYNFSISHTDQGGIVPMAKLDRLNLSANVSLNMNNFLQSNTTIIFSNTQNDYQNEGWFGGARTLINLPPNRDIRQAWNANGTPIMWASNTPHPEWLALNEYNGTLTRRWIASQALALTVLPKLSLSNRIGLDTYVDERQAYQNERPWRTEQGLTSGGTDQEKITRTQINDDLVLNMSSVQVGRGVTVSGLLGTNINMQENSRLRGRGTDVNIPGFYNISNFTTQIVSGTLPTKRRLVGIYSQATIDYNDWAFLTLTGRNDWSSTLPTKNNSYFYPSASLGIVFTDALRMQSEFLQYGKLRLSLSKVGSDAPPYSLSTRYNIATIVGADNGVQQFNGPDVRFPFRGQNAYTQSEQLGNPDLKPESTVESEVGLELRVLGGRGRIDASFYDKRSYDQIFSVPASPSTGYTSIMRNAGDLRNSGVELTVQATPVRTQNFAWDVRVNFSKNKSEVVDLADGVQSLVLAGYIKPNVQIMKGYPYGVIWGFGWRRNCIGNNVCHEGTKEGALLIGNDGLPILNANDNIPLGSIQPDWLANLNTSVSYRGVTLSALLDTRQGGKILNFEQNYTAANGRALITNERGTIHTFEGVNVNTGQPNAVGVVKDRAFYSYVYGGFDKVESSIEDGSYVKLREATLMYQIPPTLLRRFDIQSMSLYVTGRNLKVWTDFSLGDPEGSNYGSTNPAGSAYRFFSLPQTRAWTMGVRASF